MFTSDFTIVLSGINVEDSGPCFFVSYMNLSMLNEYQRCHTTITTVCDIDVIMTISGVRLPASSRTIYSYFVDMDSGNFVAWDALVPTTQSLIERGAVITIGKYGKK